MSQVLIDKAKITAIANALRTKTGSSDTYTLDEMATVIANLPTGGGIEEVATVEALEAKLIAANKGKIYRYTGTTTSEYVHNGLYEVQEDA